MNGRIQKHARRRLAFPLGTPIAKRLGACKTFLRLETALIRMHHNAGADGLTTVKSLSDVADAMLGHLFDYALAAYQRQHGRLPSPVALIALGGYGRAELSPLSDIDIMFLFPAKTGADSLLPLQQHLVDEVLYVLWDCGLKVGYSARTMNDVFAEADKSMTSKTALLEARYVAGDRDVFEDFHGAYKKFSMSDHPKAYLTDRIKDQEERRMKYGNTVFLQEPDIKKGVGGLRDYQNALWMARVKFGITQIDELHEQNYLRQNELRDFKRAYDFLLRTRNELHFQSRRPTDLLNLEAQPRVALGLGYKQSNPLRRVEQFMHDYYHSAQCIYRISRIVENRLALALGNEARATASFLETLRAHRYQKTRRIDGFVFRGRELSMESPDVFREAPERLIRVFRHCQSFNAQPDFALQGLIRESLPLISKHILHSPAANTSFRAILDEAGSVFPTLSLMHELGVLGRFIPEFDGLTCLVQHEYYHRYTADIHTLNAIRQLDAVFSGDEPICEKYRNALRETAVPTLLYLILLLHDIGKARGIKGHAEAGVAMAIPILRRLGVDAENQASVLFVIKNHLIMAGFWQRHDIDDPASAEAFAESVPDLDELRFLYVHTFCDARGTSGDLWNGYKDTLHTQLFQATLEQLVLGDSVIAGRTQRLKLIQQELVAENSQGLTHEEIDAHFKLLPRRYFLQIDTREVALHIRMIKEWQSRRDRAGSASDASAPPAPIIDWNDDLNRSLTVVNIVTEDRAGLFYKLAGAFAVAGLSILSAKVASRRDRIAIDTFYVVQPGQGIVESAQAQATFAQSISDALHTGKDLYPLIAENARRRQTPRYGAPKIAESLQSAFSPFAEVYHDTPTARTIVEIQARDEIGLLFRLARLMSKQGFSIIFARISTERNIAIDTFYIEDTDSSTAPTDPTRLDSLKTTLTHAIRPPTPA